MTKEQKRVINDNMYEIKAGYLKSYCPGLSSKQFNDILKLYNELNPLDIKRYTNTCGSCVVDLLKKLGRILEKENMLL